MKNQTDFERRSLLAMLAGLPALGSLPGLAIASSTKPISGTAPQANAGAEAKAYEVLNPPIAADTNRVRFLFSYECPFCRQYHNGMHQWGASLPKPLIFEATPVLTSASDNQFGAVLGRLIAQAVAPQVLQNYDFLTYGLLQGDPDTGQTPTASLSFERVLQTIVQAGADPKAVQPFLTGKGTGIEKQVPEHAKLEKTYKLTATPSVALMGRYVTTPDSAQGNPQQFLLLLNGIVSRYIQGGASAL